MSKKELPSGRTIFDPLAPTKQVEPNVPVQESVSAMSHEGEDSCPKCSGKMMPAIAANNVPVFFCDACRVSNPKRV